MKNKNYSNRILDESGHRMIQMGLNLIREGKELLSKSNYQSITVVSRWCNDEMIAPFFLDHYSYADEIIILLSQETTDNSKETISNYPNTRIVEFEYTNGIFDGKESTDQMESVINQVTTNWIIAVDADEFVWPNGFKDIREVLCDIDENIIYADMWQVYRHRTEMDLDPTLKAIWLRRHGDPNRTDGENARYCKPIVFRSGLNLKWGIGFHDFELNPIVQISKERFDGAHWMMADPELAIVRRLRGRKEKVSKRNIKNKWSNNNFDITEEEIKRICNEHLDDPQLF